jgi:hypothetical protein
MIHNRVAFDDTHTWIVAIVGSDEATICNSTLLEQKK